MCHNTTHYLWTARCVDRIYDSYISFRQQDMTYESTFSFYDERKIQQIYVCGCFIRIFARSPVGVRPQPSHAAWLRGVEVRYTLKRVTSGMHWIDRNQRGIFCAVHAARSRSSTIDPSLVGNNTIYWTMASDLPHFRLFASCLFILAYHGYKAIVGVRNRCLVVVLVLNIYIFATFEWRTSRGTKKEAEWDGKFHAFRSIQNRTDDYENTTFLSNCGFSSDV